ncbi:MAG: restriction endonuclease, partial [bacterium]
LYQTIAPLERVMVSCRVSKYVNQSFIKAGYIYDVATSIVTRTKWFEYSSFQSILHSIWAWKNGSTFESRIRYISADCIDTYPIPIRNHENLNSIGKTYHEHRQKLMLSMELGLTKTYNAFHAPDIQPGIETEKISQLQQREIEKQYGKGTWNLWNHLQKTENACSIEEAVEGIVKLRELHVEMDNAVLESYGWRDIDLHHDFYEVDYLPENDRVRFTIHPQARKEVLKRLLQLNHERFEEEAKKGLHKEKVVREFYQQKGQEVPKEIIDKIKEVEKEKKKKKTTTKTNPKKKKGMDGQGKMF